MGRGQEEPLGRPTLGIQQTFNQREGSVKMVRLYHYTMKQNIEQIRLTGTLKKSRKHPIGWIHGGSIENGAAFFTTMDPYTHDKAAIAKNNWANGWREKINEGRVDAYIVINVSDMSDFLSDSSPAHDVVAYRGELPLEIFDWRWGYTDMTFKLLSFNIHYRTNVDKVAKVLNDASSDIICLQECKPRHLEKLLSKLNTKYFWYLFNGSAILSRFGHTKLARERPWTEHRSFVAVWVPCLCLYVTNLHLDQKREGTRLGEVQSMTKVMGEENMILAGDFNSLKREDYSEEQWENISEVRRRKKLEPPKTDVTRLLEEQNSFVDCRSDVLPLKKSGPIATCRYDTRVDYVYQHQSVRQIWAVDYVNHIETDASDHNAVEVAFKRVLQKPNTNNFA